jgi:uncharacterized protein (TIGR02453 family)
MSPFDLGYALDFLSDLALHNERAWFARHKATYEKARLIFEGLVEELIDRLSSFEDELAGLAAKDCVMRIYRDVRFSRDKTPYNPWMTASIAPGGKKSGRFGYGLRMAPGDTVAAGGLWQPRPEQLAAFRRAVDVDPKAILSVIDALEFSRTFGELRGEKLARPPQGYPKDHVAIELLKLKQVYVARSFPDEEVTADDFVDRCMDVFLTMKPFLDWLNEKIS